MIKNKTKQRQKRKKKDLGALSSSFSRRAARTNDPLKIRQKMHATASALLFKRETLHIQAHCQTIKLTMGPLLPEGPAAPGEPIGPC